MSEGYSGSDMKLVCKEALMKPVRRLMKKIEQAETVELKEPAKFLLNNKK